ncbi:MAG TPA: tetratricopeptide repeat protein [Myxococcota bacterium]|nr:tetratricopeptide repeat protein [Myxococcota bacterium]
MARLVNMPEHRIRALARLGIVGTPSDAEPPMSDPDAEAAPPAASPGRGTRAFRFDFRDLALLRTASKLLKQGLAPLRVQRALTRLKEQVAAEMPLSGAQIFSEDGKVLASDGSSMWDAESGQCLLRFAADRTPEAVPTALVLASATPPAPLAGGSRPEPSLLPDVGGTETADYWFDLAIDCEEAEPQKAYEYYLKALACDPEHVEATINVGRLCSASGDPRRAAAYFRLASRMDPEHPVAHFNLAVTLHDMGDLRGAMASYRSALLHDPHFADAHYNLATLLEQQGEPEAAFKHFQAYRTVLREPPPA